jgi:glycosyltransferase involved in cell wall biosynthesis
MRVLYTHRTQGRGAEGVHITAVARALTGLGAEVRVLSPPGVDPFAGAGNAPVDKSRVRQGGIGRLWTLVSNRFPQFLFELMELGYNLYQIPRMARAVRTFRPDAVYERYAFFCFAGALVARLYRVPFLIEVNEVSGIARARKQQMVGLMGWIEGWVLRRATVIFTVSSYLKEAMVRKGIPAERIALQPNAIDAALFAAPRDREAKRRALGLEKKVVVGFAGWFDAWDRLDQLVEVFARVRRGAECHLLLVGAGRMMDALQAQVRELGLEGDVTFTGPVPRAEVLDFMNAMDVAVLAHSNPFGSPIVLFEFMGLGKAIVAPTLPPVTDVLSDGKDALLFTPEDWDGLEARLARVAGDGALRAQLGEAARAKALGSHTWDANARDILARLAAHTGGG